jgi:hypothetical protein
MRSPQKRPMRSPQTEPTRSLEMDPMQSPQTGAHVRAPRPPPVKLVAEGQALRERLRTFHTQAVRKTTKLQRALPRLSRYLQSIKLSFLFCRSTHNSPRPASSWRFKESAVMAIMVFVMLVNMKRFQRVPLDSL